jgi:hypothetical protein
MKLIKNEQIDPEILASINDNKNNIIISVHRSEMDLITESENCPGNFNIAITRDLNLSGSNVTQISNSILSVNYLPKIKVRLPVGVKLMFSDSLIQHNTDIFQKVYKSYEIKSVLDDNDKISYLFLDDFRLILYIDTIRLRSINPQLMIKKGTNILEFYFGWILQTQKELSMIEEIYVIYNNEVYDEFVNIF